MKVKSIIAQNSSLFYYLIGLTIVIHALINKDNSFNYLLLSCSRLIIFYGFADYLVYGFGELIFNLLSKVFKF